MATVINIRWVINCILMHVMHFGPLSHCLQAVHLSGLFIRIARSHHRTVLKHSACWRSKSFSSCDVCARNPWMHPLRRIMTHIMMYHDRHDHSRPLLPGSGHFACLWVLVMHDLWKYMCPDRTCKILQSLYVKRSHGTKSEARYPMSISPLRCDGAIQSLEGWY